MRIVELGGFLALEPSGSRTQGRYADGLLPPIERYMCSTKAIAATCRDLPDVRHKVSSELWLLLSFHSSSGERDTLIDHDDVALGGRQVDGCIDEKNA